MLYTSAQDPLAALLAASDLPVVALVDALPGLPLVAADDAAGARLLAEHLAERGHRHVAYIPGSPCPGLRRAPLEDDLRAAAAFLGMTVTECPTLSQREKLSAHDLAWLDLPRDARPTAAACWNI